MKKAEENGEESQKQNLSFIPNLSNGNLNQKSDASKKYRIDKNIVSEIMKKGYELKDIKE